MLRVAAVLIVGLAIAAGQAGATVLLVPEDHATIQSAMDVADAYDTISIAPGVYLDNASSHGPVSVIAREPVPATVLWGGLFIDAGFGTAHPCRISGLHFRRKVDVQLQCQNGLFHVTHNVFDSTITLGPAILYFPNGVQGIFENNVVRHMGWGLIASGSTSLQVRNNIFRDCKGSAVTTESNLGCTFSYNCFFNNVQNIRGDGLNEGNIFEDPLMDGTTFQLEAESPCIDAGDPASPLDPDGSRADIGTVQFGPYLFGNLVSVDSALAELLDTVVLRVSLANHAPLGGATIPLSYANTGVSLISVTHVERGLSFDLRTDLIDDVAKTVLLGYVALDSIVPAGEGPLAELTFVVTGAAPEQVIRVDSTNLPPSNRLLLVDALAREIHPGFKAGTLVVDHCPVELTGDVQLDGERTLVDIVYLVNYVLRGGPSPLPLPQAGDVDCSGAVLTSDIVYLVNYIFKLGPEPCDMCP